MRVCVMLLSPGLMNSALQQNGLPALDVVQNKLVFMAVLQNLDGLPGFPVDEHGNLILELSSSAAVRVLTPLRTPDRSIRRFIVRRMHDEFSRATLNNPVWFDDLDLAICGASVQDFLRNAQLLEQEGYLHIGSSAPNGFEATPTAKLVRDVERHGAAKDDVVTDADYLGAITSYPAVAAYEDTIRLEYQRFVSATSPLELISVFRSIAPVVEAIVMDLLKARGSVTDHGTLGPAIADLQNRGIGDAALYAQLSHILKFGRDLAQHGVSLPDSVLRIAAANAFELVPQLAALFPR
jgi:hypothetical protein